MKLALGIVIVLGLLVLWPLAWRTRPILAFGITLGLMASWIFGVVVGVPEMDTIPLWLPPLPFAVVAVTLFVFGILAWVWDDEKEGSHGPHGPERPTHGH